MKTIIVTLLIVLLSGCSTSNDRFLLENLDYVLKETGYYQESKPLVDFGFLGLQSKYGGAVIKLKVFHKYNPIKVYDMTMYRWGDTIDVRVFDKSGLVEKYTVEY